MTSTTPRGQRLRSGLLALALLLGTAGFGLASAPAAYSVDQSRGTPGFCPDDDGVTVVIDFQELGGPLIIRCARGSQSTGHAALKNAGIQIAGTNRWGEAFICRIEGKPGPGSEPCIDTPPASAYWSYWHAPNGGNWTYSQWGVTNRKPPTGSFEGWSFSKNKSSTTNPPPRIAPQRPVTAPPPPTTEPGTSGGSSSGGSSSGGSSSGGSNSGGSNSGGSSSGGSSSGGGGTSGGGSSTGGGSTGGGSTGGGSSTSGGSSSGGGGTPGGGSSGGGASSSGGGGTPGGGSSGGGASTGGGAPADGGAGRGDSVAPGQDREPGTSAPGPTTGAPAADRTAGPNSTSPTPSTSRSASASPSTSAPTSAQPLPGTPGPPSEAPAWTGVGADGLQQADATAEQGIPTSTLVGIAGATALAAAACVTAWRRRRAAGEPGETP
ncbi:hypothetical protein [Streptomyces sp. NPDC004435]|uniref:hypothetical protein n=1 Tax=Streptomyces sp. NPDC004435 TaxID=3364701 RepID=UPI0036A67048